MFVPFPYSFRGDGTSRWFWYGLFLSLSENVPGVMPPKAVTYSQQLNRNLTRAIWCEVSK